MTGDRDCWRKQHIFHLRNDGVMDTHDNGISLSVFCSCKANRCEINAASFRLRNDRIIDTHKMMYVSTSVLFMHRQARQQPTIYSNAEWMNTRNSRWSAYSD